MQQLNYRQRQRWMAEAEQEVWEASARPRAIRDGYEGRDRLPLRLVVAPMGKFINQGGLLRTAEAFMVEQVDFTGEAAGCEFSGHRGTIGWQPHRFTDGLESLRELKAQGRRIYGLTLNDCAVNYADVEWEFPCALAVGQELVGLEQEWEAMCDVSVAIPMFGLTTSLNVVAATAICLSRAAQSHAMTNPSWHPIRSESARLLNQSKRLPRP